MPTPPIIVIKKKGGHGGHHGGAWKVAYADFVTAMMALFIVLWLMNSSKQLQVAVGGYFKDPTGTSKKVGTNQSGAGDNFQLTKQNMSRLKEQLQKGIHSINDLEKLRKNIEMTVTAEGLRIELLESKSDTFFNSGSSDLNQTGKEMLVLLAQELGKVPNRISVEGHTDATPYGERANYSNWELSSDRANAARRLMQQSGLRADQVSQVRGFADQRLRTPNDPLDPSNRRISIIVQYITKDADDEPAEPGKDSGEASKEKSGKAEGESEPKAAGAATKKKADLIGQPGEVRFFSCCYCIVVSEPQFAVRRRGNADGLEDRAAWGHPEREPSGWQHTRMCLPDLPRAATL